MEQAAAPQGSAVTRKGRHVAVLIINWNQAALAVRAVRSALDSLEVQITVLVIDNGSHPGSVEEVTKSLDPGAWTDGRLASHSVLRPSGSQDILIVLAGENLGFTGANNIGFELAFRELDMDYCFLLNCDAELRPTTLRSLIDAAQAEPQVGLVGALILDGHDGTESTVSFGRGQLSRIGWPTSLDHGRPRSTVPYSGVSAVEIVGGAAMLVPRTTYDAIGGQDNRYFFDVDDTEISLRAIRAGLHNYMVWEALVQHEMGSSVKGRSALSRYYNVRNLLLLQADYLRGWRRAAFLAKFFVRVARDLMVSLVRGEPARAKAVLLAVLHYWLRRTGRGPNSIYEH